MLFILGAFNQEKVLVGAFFVIVKTDCTSLDSFARALELNKCNWRQQAAISHNRITEIF